MNSRKLMWWIGIPGVLLVLGVMAFAIFEPIQVLPRIRLAPGYLLKDQHQASVTSEDVRGDITLYTFRYSGCGDDCAGIDQTMIEVNERLDEVDFGDTSFRQVTISFDPENDTPEVLAADAEAFGASEDQWKFVTGTESHLRNVIGAGFRVPYQEQDDGTYAFDPTLILVDGWGVIRGEYEYQTLASDADKIIHHLDILTEEIRNANGAAALAYEAAHLFLCYP
ncbi:MAG: SCO family protein [Actinomycetota bacterium]|nr:SCO family protein [Actinomycetota bacterium]